MPIYTLQNAESSSGGTGTHKSGLFDIPVNTDSIQVVFATQMLAVDYHIDISLKNDIDANVNGYTWYVKQQTVNGFIIVLSGKVNTGSYKAMWKTYLD